MWGEKKIRNSRKPDLRGRKDANDMIIKNTHKIISDMIFIIDKKTISDIIRNQECTNHTGYDFTCQNIIRWSVQDGSGNDSEPPTVATAAESADFAGCP
ncbi:TPA: hypothetical protein ACUPQ2_004745 [Escherichia coli]